MQNVTSRRRDRGSLKELASLGITRPPIEPTADPVHAIHQVDTAQGREILLRHGALVGQKPLVCISVREWCNMNHYKEIVAQAADRIVEDFQAQVVFLPMQYPEDVKTAQMVADMAQHEMLVLPEEYNTSQLLSIVGNMDLLISVRLHALIFAGVMGVPMIGISYDPKVDRFLESVGEESVGTLENVELEKLMAQIHLKWKDREGFSQQNEQLFDDLRHLAMCNAELAYSVIGKD